jgi:hypothetical protein
VAFSVVGLVFAKYNAVQNAIQVIVYGALGLATTVLVVSGVLDYLKWYNDCVVITNRRMMRFEGLFNRHMVESVLDKINDVTLNQTFWGRVFGYGDVTVLTAAESGIQEMRNIAKPFEFKQALFKARSMDADGNDADDEQHVDMRHQESRHHDDEHQHQAEYQDDDNAHRDMSDVDAVSPTPPRGNEERADGYDQQNDDDEERATILKQLEILHAKGILDDDEFNTKIQRLYGKDA